MCVCLTVFVAALLTRQSNSKGGTLALYFGFSGDESFMNLSLLTPPNHFFFLIQTRCCSWKHVKHTTSCAAEDFPWERITRQRVFRPNVKQLIMWEQVKSPLGHTFTLRPHGLLQNPPNIMAPGRKETRALFPHLSPPLPPLYIQSLLHFPPLLQSLILSLHYFIVSQCHFHCLAFLRAVPHTGPPPGLRNTPSTCLPGSFMSSCFPNPVQQTRQLGATLDLYLCWCLTHMSF